MNKRNSTIRGQDSGPGQTFAHKKGNSILSIPGAPAQQGAGSRSLARKSGSQASPNSRNTVTGVRNSVVAEPKVVSDRDESFLRVINAKARQLWNQNKEKEEELEEGGARIKKRLSTEYGKTAAKSRIGVLFKTVHEATHVSCRAKNFVTTWQAITERKKALQEATQQLPELDEEDVRGVSGGVKKIMEEFYSQLQETSHVCEEVDPTLEIQSLQAKFKGIEQKHAEVQKRRRETLTMLERKPMGDENTDEMAMTSLEELHKLCEDMREQAIQMRKSVVQIGASEKMLVDWDPCGELEDELNDLWVTVEHRQAERMEREEQLREKGGVVPPTSNNLASAAGSRRASQNIPSLAGSTRASQGSRRASEVFGGSRRGSHMGSHMGSGRNSKEEHSPLPDLQEDQEFTSIANTKGQGRRSTANLEIPGAESSHRGSLQRGSLHRGSLQLVPRGSVRRSTLGVGMGSHLEFPDSNSHLVQSQGSSQVGGRRASASLIQGQGSSQGLSSRSSVRRSTLGMGMGSQNENGCRDYGHAAAAIVARHRKSEAGEITEERRSILNVIPTLDENVNSSSSSASFGDSSSEENSEDPESESEEAAITACEDEIVAVREKLKSQGLSSEKIEAHPEVKALGKKLQEVKANAKDFYDKTGQKRLRQKRSSNKTGPSNGVPTEKVDLNTAFEHRKSLDGTGRVGKRTSAMGEKRESVRTNLKLTLKSQFEILVPPPPPPTMDQEVQVDISPDEQPEEENMACACYKGLWRLGLCVFCGKHMPSVPDATQKQEVPGDQEVKPSMPFGKVSTEGQAATTLQESIAKNRVPAMPGSPRSPRQWGGEFFNREMQRALREQQVKIFPSDEDEDTRDVQTQTILKELEAMEKIEPYMEESDEDEEVLQMFKVATSVEEHLAVLSISCAKSGEADEKLKDVSQVRDRSKQNLMDVLAAVKKRKKRPPVRVLKGHIDEMMLDVLQHRVETLPGPAKVLGLASQIKQAVVPVDYKNTKIGIINPAGLSNQRGRDVPNRMRKRPWTEHWLGCIKTEHEVVDHPTPEEPSHREPLPLLPPPPPDLKKTTKKAEKRGALKKDALHNEDTAVEEKKKHEEEKKKHEDIHHPVAIEERKSRLSLSLSL